MPGTETKHKVRDVNVRMLRGRLGSAGPVPARRQRPAAMAAVLRPDRREMRRCSCPNIRASAPPTIRPGCATSATSRCTTSISSTGLAPQGASGRPVARRLGCGRGRGAQLHADREPDAAGAGRHPGEGPACPATTSSGTPRNRSATSITTRPSPINAGRCRSRDEQADIMLGNRFTAAKLGWEPRWYNPSLERWLHRITRADTGGVGRERQAVPGRLCRALGRAGAGLHGRDHPAMRPRAGDREAGRSPRRKSSQHIGRS